MPKYPKIIDKLAEFRKEDSLLKDGHQLDLFHYLDDPTVSDEKLSKLIKDEEKK